MADEHLPHDGPAPAVGVGPADQPVTGFAVAPGAATQAAGGSAPDPGARAGDDASAPPGGRPGGGAPPPDPSTPPTAPSPGTQRRGRRARPVIAVVLVVLLMLGSGVTGGIVARALDDDPEPQVTGLWPPPPRESTSGARAPDEPLSNAAAAVLPSVVSIAVGSGRGSGVIISPDGLILTNDHVVANAERLGLRVLLHDGTTVDGQLVGRDPATDLAVVRIDAEGLTPAPLGRSADLIVGDTVLAIGSPLGLDGSVTAGIVSALNRAITLDGGSGGPGGGPPAVIDAIQTDAAINPGNSGGPLINTAGEVVGINTAIASLAGERRAQGGNIGVGFAIPIDAARYIADQLVREGRVEHAYLGVRMADGERGALIGIVEAGSPAAEAGLRPGDVVTRVDDTQVRDAAGLTAAVRAHRPGDDVTIVYDRDGEERSTEVTLGTLAQ